RWLIIAIISFLVGTLIRFYYGLNTDLWNDEAISYFISRDTTWTDLFFSKGNYHDLMHPPLYYIFLKLMLIINEADWWLRLTSLVWFFPSIYLVYKIASFFKNRKTTLLAISLFSLHPLLINLAFQVRSYSLLIFFMLFIIYMICSNFFQPKLSKTIFIALLLSISFFINYGAIWLIFSLFFLGIYLFFSEQKIHSKNLFLSLILFFVFSIYQIIILLNYLLIKKIGSPIAGSVPYFDINWLIYHLRMLLGNDYIGFYLPLILIINTINFKKNKLLINQFFFFSFLTTVLLAIIISIFLFPVFLARQLVLFSIISVFVFAQFHQKLRQELVLFLTLVVYTINSLTGYNFLFATNIETTIKNKVPSNSIILLLDDYDSINYYLIVNRNNSSIYSIKRYIFKNQDLEDKLLTESITNVFFIKNQFISNDELETKKSLQDNICQKYHCVDLDF
ncbi:MAG: glycosyltransferase family 39 protein, partial [Candidatus Pacebacteria bacterium]|nr:glycosyltransferase family 39 protein [Candidatus Paceibacterota bacterium]